VVCAPLNCREALLAAAQAGLPVWQALRAVAQAGLPDVVVEPAAPQVLGGAAELVVLVPVRAAPRVLDVLAAVLDAPARAWPGVQDGAAALGVLAAVRVAPRVLDVLAGAQGALAAVRVAPRVPDGAAEPGVLVAAPAGSRLVPPPWWALCGLAADGLPEPPDVPARLADGRVACGSELRPALRQAR
jgi:hypothetical protein